VALLTQHLLVTVMVRLALALQGAGPLEAVMVTAKAAGKPPEALALTHVMTAAVLFATAGKQHTVSGNKDTQCAPVHVCRHPTVTTPPVCIIIPYPHSFVCSRCMQMQTRTQDRQAISRHALLVALHIQAQAKLRRSMAVPVHAPVLFLKLQATSVVVATTPTAKAAALELVTVYVRVVLGA